MHGWKTKVGGGLAIVAGVCGYLITLFGYQGLPADTALGLVSGGIATIGLGHKADKLLDVLKVIAADNAKK